MGKQFTFFLVLLLSILTVFSQKQAFGQNVGEKDYIHINDIYLPFDNKGNIADVSISGQQYGGYFQGHEFLFSAGFWLTGYTNDTLWANGETASSSIKDYQPGIFGMDPSDPKASLYKLRAADPPFGQSWQDWIDAVDLGADFYDGDGDGIYNPVDLNNNGVWDLNEDKPDLLGNETFWCVYNDGVPANQRPWGSEPQGIEIRQTIFAFASSSNLEKVVFIRYRIKNTSLTADTLKDVYFCNFADSDIGEVDGYNHNLTGTDTLRNAGYTYMNQPSPQDWGASPPCFMTDMLTGPLSYIPGVSFEDVNGNGIFDQGIDTPLDTAYSYRGPLGVPVYPGALNLSLSSSIFYLSGSPILNGPANITQARNNLLGLTTAGEIVDPCNWAYGEVRGGIPCDDVDPLYWNSGDPVSNVGWISTAIGDVRNIQSVGPFKLIKDKEIEILVAFELGRGNSALGSVTIAGNISDEIQTFYENNFDYPYVLGVKDKQPERKDFSLYQNYPNPFNPMTTIKYEIRDDGIVQLKVYDILGKEVETLLNENQPAGSHSVQFNGKGLSSGVYFYQLKAGSFSKTRKLLLIK